MPDIPVWADVQEKLAILGATTGKKDRASAVLERSSINQFVASPAQAKAKAVLVLMDKLTKGRLEVLNIVDVMITELQMSVGDKRALMYTDICKAIEHSEAQQKSIIEKFEGVK